MQESNGSSSNLIVGIILGILILGGIFLYMRNTGAPASNGSVDINVKVPDAVIPDAGGDTNGR